LLPPATDVRFVAKCTKCDFEAQTPLGELTSLHRPLGGIRGERGRRGVMEIGKGK